MLYLKLTADDVHQQAPRQLPLAPATAARLERALLTSDSALKQRELHGALLDDPNFAAWALRLAEHRTGRTVNQVDEAADWLSKNVVSELALALTPDDSSVPPSDVEWRLCALVARLHDCERQLASFEQRLEHEKLESLKELAYGASHEINNPLANIAARAQTLLQDEDDSERARKLTAIHRQAMRAHEMISDLMLFARPPKLDKRPIDLRTLVQTVVQQQGESAAEREITLACELGDAPTEATVDATQISVALAALVRNSLEAVADAGDVHVTVRKITDGPEPIAEIAVRDNGPGISAEIRQHVFDPFYSGREAGRGLGFGLSKCWRIVTDHGGQVVVHQPAAGGAEISILLPCSTEKKL